MSGSIGSGVFAALRFTRPVPLPICCWESSAPGVVSAEPELGSSSCIPHLKLSPSAAPPALHPSHQPREPSEELVLAGVPEQPAQHKELPLAPHNEGKAP